MVLLNEDFTINIKHKTKSEIYYSADDQTSTTIVTKPRSEGFRVEIRPSHNKKESLVSKLFQSHIKLDTLDNRIEEVTKTKYTPVSIFPKTELLYSPKFKINSIEEVLKKKMPSRDDLPNTIFSNIKKRALLSTLFKESDYGMPQNLEKSFHENVSDAKPNVNAKDFYSINFIEDSKIDNKRANEISNANAYPNVNVTDFYKINVIEDPKIDNKRTNEISNANAFRKLFKEKNQFIKNLVSKYIRNDNFSHSNQNMVLLNVDKDDSTLNTEANIENYISELTKNNIWLFSTPYFYSHSQEQITVPPRNSIAETSLMLLELNNTSSSEHTHERETNLTDITVSIEDTKIKPVAIDLNDIRKQMYLNLKHPIVKENANTDFEIPFLVNNSDLPDEHYKFDELHTATPSMLPETSTNEVDTFQLLKRIRRFKRNVGTANTVLEKSNVTINESPSGVTEINKDISVNDSRDMANSSVNGNFSSQHNITTNNITISDFFMMISNWFKMLEGIKVHEDKSRLNPG